MIVIELINDLMNIFSDIIVVEYSCHLILVCLHAIG